MNSTERFIALLVTIITGMGVIMGGILWTLRALWNIRGSWDATNAELHSLVDDVKALVIQKEKEHSRLELRDDRLESRMERHEAWHAENRRRM